MVAQEYSQLDRKSGLLDNVGVPNVLENTDDNNSRRVRPALEQVPVKIDNSIEEKKPDNPHEVIVPMKMAPMPK